MVWYFDAGFYSFFISTTISTIACVDNVQLSWFLSSIKNVHTVKENKVVENDSVHKMT